MTNQTPTKPKQTITVIRHPITKKLLPIKIEKTFPGIKGLLTEKELYDMISQSSQKPEDVNIVFYEEKEEKLASKLSRIEITSTIK